MSHVTLILNQIDNDNGGSPAAEQLLPLVYKELRQLATLRMLGERSDHTLQATALVHEAYLRLVGKSDDQGWESRGHFFAAAAEAMRRILVENARRKSCLKRSGVRQRVSPEAVDCAISEKVDRFLALNEAIQKLSVDHSERAEVVKMRYFSGLTIKQTAEALGISTATADRHWSFARAWLQAELTTGDDTPAV
ncbi:MAG: RNA polymerase sigma factor (TIGR02999 family) [Pirellulaceae bacterium]|jgi:RNA polymerase sigma factor (TIGR02999 family)